ncbi:MAG: sugar transporter [Candidatus Dadabacteria bacterium]|nr:MAG: sugar transporter [Candidatus Dadabacteria bacterium]
MRRVRIRFPIVAACLIGWAIGGCAARKPSPAAYGLPAPEVAPAGLGAPAGEYRIAVGDQLGIRFLYHPELNASPQVRTDGRITVPGLGDFEAAGLRADELERALYRRASLTYRNPSVTVVVKEQAERRAYVGGEVRRPGFVALRPGMTSLRAIFERGGFLDTAKVDSVLHIHWEPNGSYRARVLDLKTVLETGDIRGDVVLGANDVVFVPKTPIANADLWVRQYILDLIPVREPTTRLPDIAM